MAAVKKLTNKALSLILFPGKFLSQSKYLKPHFAMIHKEPAKPCVTLTLLWIEF